MLLYHHVTFGGKSAATGNGRCGLICKIAAKVQILLVKVNKKK